MGLLNFFHKIKIGFVRLKEPSIPFTSAAKKYGEWGESDLVDAIRSRLPACEVKKNVIIRSFDGDAEIDCLVLYKNKLIAIEVKHWKGQLVEQGEHFIQYKPDRWTNETHTRTHKSPFKQLRRAIYLLKKINRENAWINPVVFFEGLNSIKIESEGVWFDDFDVLASYINHDAKASRANDAKRLFDRCVAADYVYCRSWGRFLHCQICDESLCFKTPFGVLTRKDIVFISINHHWSYDELKITTVDGRVCNIDCENGSIIVNDDGNSFRYSLSKLDYIELG